MDAIHADLALDHRALGRHAIEQRAEPCVPRRVGNPAVRCPKLYFVLAAVLVALLHRDKFHAEVFERLLNRLALHDSDSCQVVNMLGLVRWGCRHEHHLARLLRGAHPVFRLLTVVLQGVRFVENQHGVRSRITIHVGKILVRRDADLAGLHVPVAHEVERNAHRLAVEAVAPAERVLLPVLLDRLRLGDDDDALPLFGEVTGDRERLPCLACPCSIGVQEPADLLHARYSGGCSLSLVFVEVGLEFVGDNRFVGMLSMLRSCGDNSLGGRS